MSAVLCLPACLRVSAAASRGQAPHGNASLGVVASRLRGFVPHPLIPLLYRHPRKASLSRPLSGPKSSSRRLNQNQDPSKGQF